MREWNENPWSLMPGWHCPHRKPRMHIVCVTKEVFSGACLGCLYWKGHSHTAVFSSPVLTPFIPNCVIFSFFICCPLQNKIKYDSSDNKLCYKPSGKKRWKPHLPQNPPVTESTFLQHNMDRKTEGYYVFRILWPTADEAQIVHQFRFISS